MMTNAKNKNKQQNYNAKVAARIGNQKSNIVSLFLIFNI